VIRFRLMAANGKVLAEKTLGQFPVIFGRGAESGVEVRDAGVSSRHAEIDWDGTHLHLRDVGSRNGTFVNDESVSEIVLNLPCTFRLGSQIIVEAELLDSQANSTGAIPSAAHRLPAVFRASPPQSKAASEALDHAITVEPPPSVGEERYWHWLRNVAPAKVGVAAVFLTFMLLVCHWLVFRESLAESAFVALAALIGGLLASAISAALLALPGALFRAEYVFKPLFLQSFGAVLVSSFGLALRPAFLYDQFGILARIFCVLLAALVCVSGPYVFLFTTFPHRQSRRLFLISGVLSALLLSSQAYSLFTMSKRALVHAAFVGDFHASRGLAGATMPVGAVTNQLREFGARH
jgi:pSer/pThr/pTyr-binding forkhead associated (FHA) protein